MPMDMNRIINIRKLMKLTTVFFMNSLLSMSPVNSFHERFYYQIMSQGGSASKINKVTVNENPFVLYHYNHTYHALNDKCPHQGASLSKGWINHKGNIHCPYHAFEFDSEGHFCGIPDPSNCHERVQPTKKQHGSSRMTFEFGNDLFLCPSPEKNSHTLPYYPPEHFNDEFVHTSCQQVIPQNYKVVTENVLDMLHISYVHSFGNREFPLPKNIFFRKLNDFSGRSTFHYKPYEYTISNKIGRSPIVIVENEYHLPTTTVTRVIAGDIVKTVLTRSTPISENKTLFSWKVYRNFWKSDKFPCVTLFGDILMNMLMKRTLQEDIDILKHVYPDAREGSLVTKYDVTIQNYRKALKEFLH